MTPEKEKALISTKKAIGTLTKVLEMIEKDQYCPDIIQQIDSVSGLMKSTRSTLLVGHLDHCLVDKLNQDKSGTIKELMKIYSLGK